MVADELKKELRKALGPAPVPLLVEGGNGGEEDELARLQVGFFRFVLFFSFFGGGGFFGHTFVHTFSHTFLPCLTAWVGCSHLGCLIGV